MAGRPKVDSKRVSCRLLPATYNVLRNDALSKGYRTGSNAVDWQRYLGAIAGLIVQGRINLPKRVDE